MSYEETWSYTRRAPANGGTTSGGLQNQQPLPSLFNSQPPSQGLLGNNSLFGAQPGTNNLFNNSNSFFDRQPQSNNLFGPNTPQPRTNNLFGPGGAWETAKQSGLIVTSEQARHDAALIAQNPDIPGALSTLYSFLPSLSAETGMEWNHIDVVIRRLVEARLQAFPQLSQQEEQRLRSAGEIMCALIAHMGRTFA